MSHVSRRLSLALLVLSACQGNVVTPPGAGAGSRDAGRPDPVAPDARVRPPDAAAPADAAPPEPTEVTSVFVWPLDGWVVSTDRYQNGDVHSGSADVAVPYFTPVGAARGGTVIRSELTSIGGWLVEIDHGAGYTTVYSHLVGEPLVEVGAVVETNQLIGHSGRTGRAFQNGPHLHLAIKRDGVRLPIPGLEFGQWVVRGQPIAGTYGLELVTSTPPVVTVEVVVDGLDVRAAPDEAAPVVGELPAGTFVDVLGTDQGFLRLAGAVVGWAPQSGVAVTAGRVFGVRVVASATIREQPGAGDSMGTLDTGTLATVFEARDGWYRILTDVPAVYGWIAAAKTEPTHEFEAQLRASRATLRAGPGAEFLALGELTDQSRRRVHETSEGWYRIEHDGEPAWLPGWLTQGRF